MEEDYFCEECGVWDRYHYPHSHVYWCDMCENVWPHLHIVSVEEALTFTSGDKRNTDSWDYLFDYKRGDGLQMSALLDVICEEGVRQGFAPAVDRQEWQKGRGRFRDGHHRLTVLYDLGAKFFPIQFRECHASDTQSYKDAKERASSNRQFA